MAKEHHLGDDGIKLYQVNVGKFHGLWWWQAECAPEGIYYLVRAEKLDREKLARQLAYLAHKMMCEAFGNPQEVDGDAWYEQNAIAKKNFDRDADALLKWLED